MELNTYFYNATGERFASLTGLVSIVPGTVVKTRDGQFTVKQAHLNLNNHSNTDGEELGLQLFCEAM